MQRIRLICTIFLLFTGLTVFSQPFNNEWIKYENSYFKFKIFNDGVYRISANLLQAKGLANAPAEQFHLFRNGQEVPLYTSVVSGPIPANGFIEFIGKANDGVPDRPLYRNPAYQHTTAYNLHHDSVAYFLTVDASVGKRYVKVDNKVAENTLPAEPYFMHTYGRYFKNIINPGLAADILGQYIFSSAYDRGEFWSSADIRERLSLAETVGGLNVAVGGPAASLKFGAFGNTVKTRTVRAELNNTILLDTAMNFFTDILPTVSFSPALIATNTANIRFTNIQPPKPPTGIDPYTDRFVLSFYELTYPRLFNFGNSTRFSFNLDPRPAGYFLDITNFNSGSVAPVLYDSETMERYEANTGIPNRFRFALTGTSAQRKLVLVGQQAAAISNVLDMHEKRFVDYTNAAYQGNYLIISSSRLFNEAAGANPVEAYRIYRSSVQGGSYSAKIFDIDDLTDQFAFGIKGHPLAVKNFASFARNRFSNPISKLFIIGKGVVYTQYRNPSIAERPRLSELNLVPTYGSPGSDNSLVSAAVDDPRALIDIGRLSAISAIEVENYLEKVKEYEQAQQTPNNRMQDKLWMKNVLNVTGATDALLGEALCRYVNDYKRLFDDTLTGASTIVLCKNVSGGDDQAGASIIKEKIEEGISLLTYFGHSSASTLGFSIQDPFDYNNQGKYPVFSVNGCYAGDFFSYSIGRLQVLETLTEKYVLAKQRGAIAFLASTHYGVSSYLSNYLNFFFDKTCKSDYGETLGKINRDALAATVNSGGAFDFLARAHAEEINLHGDPAIKLNFQERPDYVVEESSINISPSFISVSDQNYHVKLFVTNQGKAIGDSVQVEMTRVAPDGTTSTLFNSKIAGVRLMDSVDIEIPIIASKDKGQNYINIRLDGGNAITEMDEGNNYISKAYYIYEDEASPAYPYNYSIVSDQAVKFYASTADPFSLQKQYVMEIDTTSLFNSPLKRSVTISSKGGLLEFNPQVSFADSTVYYWRTSLVPSEGGEFKWNQFSFLFKTNTETGFNQSHYFQHGESDLTKMVLDANRKWEYAGRTNSLLLRQALYPTSGTEGGDFAVVINDRDYINSACVGNSLIFNVLDSRTFLPWKNVDENGNNLFRFGSGSANCDPSRNWNFEFSYMSAASRKLIMDFMDSIPNGSFVVIRSIDYNNPNSYAATWRGDTTLYGSGNSLYHKLFALGGGVIDSINAPKCWGMIYHKGNSAFIPQTKVSKGLYDRLFISTEPVSPGSNGSISSPAMGPAKAWQRLVWKGHSMDSNADIDRVSVEVLGQTSTNTIVPLKQFSITETNMDISDISATQYPKLLLRMRSTDSMNYTPYQLDYWRILYEPVPEGAIAPNLFFTTRDTVELGETVDFGIAFKNISTIPFDSLKIKVILTDASNVPHILPVGMLKPLVSGDTVMFHYKIDPTSYPGLNTLYIDFNPDNAQPEQYHFNNFLFRNIFVKSDKSNPLLDVTFDGAHILNGDIVSAKPHIQIKLKDESKFLLLKDTSLMRVQVRYPDQTVRTFRFDNDTVRFTPATSAADNTATIDFSPSFLQTFDIESGIDNYQLIVTGKDASNNPAGKIEYNVDFMVINKPMISNLLNYPNPFSTSTAFVFTLTGSEIPTNFKIQILTVTGKVVREITGLELGPLRIGRNITDYKWDGTDQFGQRLANGVYLYRVITTLNGKALEKYKARNDNTDKFFTKGYGKMYLIK